MSILVIAEHDNKSLKGTTLNTVAAATKISDEISVLYQGEIIENGPTSQIINNPKNTYTKSLISSVYDLEI